MQALKFVESERENVLRSLKNSMELSIQAVGKYLPLSLGLVVAWDDLDSKEKTHLLSSKRSRLSNLFVDDGSNVL